MTKQSICQIEVRKDGEIETTIFRTLQSADPMTCRYCNVQYRVEKDEVLYIELSQPITKIYWQKHKNRTKVK